MSEKKRNFLFLNVGHLFDHFFMLIFTTAVLTMESEFMDSYDRILALTMWGFIFFGGASIPAGWLGDRWSKHGMMLVFFVGIGAASIITGFSTTPGHVEIGLALIGIFGAIYHPIGLALVVKETDRVGRALAINGVWGNMGVATAALTTGAIAEFYGWRMAFMLPGFISVGIGLLYGWHLWSIGSGVKAEGTKKTPKTVPISLQRKAFLFLLIAPLFGGLIFQATTVALPKIMDDRLAGIFANPSEIGFVAFCVFACAAVAQLIVGELLDRYPVKPLYLGILVIQTLFCVLAISAVGWSAVAVALPLMLATFGIIPINDWIVAHFISTEYRSRVYAVKSVFSLGVAAVAVKVTSYLYGESGSFDTLFMVLAASAVVVLAATVALLPGAAGQSAARAPAE